MDAELPRARYQVPPVAAVATPPPPKTSTQVGSARRAVHVEGRQKNGGNGCYGRQTLSSHSPVKIEVRNFALALDDRAHGVSGGLRFRHQSRPDSRAQAGGAVSVEDSRQRCTTFGASLGSLFTCLRSIVVALRGAYKRLFACGFSSFSSFFSFSGFGIRTCGFPLAFSRGETIGCDRPHPLFFFSSPPIFFHTHNLQSSTQPCPSTLSSAPRRETSRWSSSPSRCPSLPVSASLCGCILRLFSSCFNLALPLFFSLQIHRFLSPAKNFHAARASFLSKDACCEFCSWNFASNRSNRLARLALLPTATNSSLALLFSPFIRALFLP